MSEKPNGELTTRTMAMPADSNPSGDIFGGWVLSQMDIAAGICARERARCRVVTVALDGMHFIRPVKIGDSVNIASRLNGLAKGGEIIISDQTYAIVKDMIVAEEQSPQVIKGIARPVVTYRVLGLKGQMII